MYRQGDVLLIRTRVKIEPAAKRVGAQEGRIILAHGEVTGHTHAVSATDATLFMIEKHRFLRVNRPTVLRHEEHDPIDLPEGDYRVVQQREYSPQEIRYVLD